MAIRLFSTVCQALSLRERQDIRKNISCPPLSGLRERIERSASIFLSLVPVHVYFPIVSGSAFFYQFFPIYAHILPPPTPPYRPSPPPLNVYIVGSYSPTQTFTHISIHMQETFIYFQFPINNSYIFYFYLIHLCTVSPVSVTYGPN